MGARDCYRRYQSWVINLDDTSWDIVEPAIPILGQWDRFVVAIWLNQVNQPKASPQL